jgi:GT2 family glycosyltransferase/exopolysaccharide biosynthesis predicted pyruvyltransferase EpsI
VTKRRGDVHSVSSTRGTSQRVAGSASATDAQQAAFARSRAEILREIGDADDLTFIRGLGNIGDQLIWAGTRELLSRHIYREITHEQVAHAQGHTALITGGGAFCRFHAWMPRLLAVAELRFERVIVLPSSFDPGDDNVRRSLSLTGATVFARETQSYRRIAPMCDARLAHDCAFFFDYEPFRRRGRGVLNAFRDDLESARTVTIPAGNEDISETCGDLDEWLEKIAGHSVVRTDRAHVMIAAAMLGKRVEYAVGRYHKVEAIADYALASFPVSKLATARETIVAAPSTVRRPSEKTWKKLLRLAGEPTGTSDSARPRDRITAVVLTQGRPELALGAVDSIARQSVGARTIVHDNNSPPAEADALASGCASRTGVELRLSNRNLGCAGGRRLVLESVDSELTLLLDDDAELLPGALAHLVAELDQHPEAAGVTATVLSSDGRVMHSGGWAIVTSELVELTSVGSGLQASDPAIPASGPSGWLPGTAALIRTELLNDFPLDDGLGVYYEDAEWSFRVEQARPGSFRRSREALALHLSEPKIPAGIDFAGRSAAVEFILAQAHFYRRHGLLLWADLFALVPELRLPDGTADLAAARLLMELTLANGTDWAFMEWMNGGLEPLLGRASFEADREKLAASLREAEQNLNWLAERNSTLTRIESGGWWRLRGRLLPLLRVASAVRRRPGS